MKISVDMGYQSSIYVGEELCGDIVKLADTEDSRILVLADGMGHGIRANMLATLTATIIATMLQQKMTIPDVVSTISKTLPVSSVNGVAYSTFSIIQIFNNGEVYIVEFDNPEAILIRNGKIEKLPFHMYSIDGKVVRECRIQAQAGDAYAVMSDGCLYCGTEQTLNYMWNWQSVAELAQTYAPATKTAAQLAKRMQGKCVDLYGGKPLDDVTVAVARIVEDRAVNILTGPPVREEDDARYINDFMESDGVKIVAGGVTGKIAARELGTPLIPLNDSLDPEIPPTSKIKGIDLVTEGVLTMNRVVEMLEMYVQDEVPEEFYDMLCVENGATRIVCYLMEDCTTVNLFVGTGVNNDYNDKIFPFAITARHSIVERLTNVLGKMHIRVETKYY